MAQNRVHTYEGMFLISQAVATDFGGAIAHIRAIIEKAGGEIIAMKKWDERRLAYEIDKQKRGIYILAYFSCPGVNIAQIERATNLSEQIMRTMIIRVEHMTVDEMKASDGQRELEAEARLRASQPAPVAAVVGTPAQSAPVAADAGAEDGEA